MKFAILFSGRIHYFKKCYELIQNHIVKDNEVDFFLSHTKNTDENELTNFIDLYKPKKVCKSDEIYPNVDHYPTVPATNKHNIMCMFLNRLKVFQIFEDYCNETNSTYDVVFSCRLDAIVLSDLPIPLYIENIQNGDLFIPSGNDFFGINDRFAFSNFNTMKIYMYCYHSLIDLFEEGVLVHPEIVLNHYLRSKNIKIQRFNVLFDFLY